MKWAVLKDFGQPLDMHYDIPSMILTERVQDENWYSFGLEAKRFDAFRGACFVSRGRRLVHLFINTVYEMYRILCKVSDWK